LNVQDRTLRKQLAQHLAEGATSIAILGASPEALLLASQVRALAGENALLGIFDPDAVDERRAASRAWSELAKGRPDVLVIAADADKERLLCAAAAVFDPTQHLPRVILAGLAHQSYGDPIFEQLEQPALVPSYATGHPSTRVHLYQVLQHAARQGLSGVVVELGAFKGGTTVWLAKAVAALGLEGTKVIGFDSWDGFPPRRSLLDLYEHPRCVFRDLDAVRAYVDPYGIELVEGDIAETVPARLASESVLLAFVDTDNYSGALAALQAIVPNLVGGGGAVVFDHYFTTEDYVYTIGERLAAREALEDSDLLQLHGTGVFVKTGY
jgi:O-methyltransferase